MKNRNNRPKLNEDLITFLHKIHRRC